MRNQFNSLHVKCGASASVGLFYSAVPHSHKHAPTEHPHATVFGVCVLCLYNYICRELPGAPRPIFREQRLEFKWSMKPQDQLQINVWSHEKEMLWGRFSSSNSGVGSVEHVFISRLSKIETSCCLGVSWSSLTIEEKTENIFGFQELM